LFSAAILKYNTVKYKAIKGLTCEPYNKAISAGSIFDNNIEKLSDAKIQQAISEKRIIPIEEKKQTRSPKKATKK
jgi:hypothetical protein